MEWIPISERLPENGHYYLWCSDMGSVQSDYYWDGFEKEQKYGFNIVAWMPLPKPYRAEQTKPTISKMEQVDKDINVRSKDKPRAEGVWNAGYKTGYDKGYKDAQKVKDSQDLVKDLVKVFCEDGTWLERQGVYTLTLAEAKQRAVDIIESVLAKTEPQTEREGE